VPKRPLKSHNIVLNFLLAISMDCVVVQTNMRWITMCIIDPIFRIIGFTAALNRGPTFDARSRSLAPFFSACSFCTGEMSATPGDLPATIWILAFDR
jgi:hypothetical protein